MVQGSTKKSKSAGRVGAAQKSKNAAKYRKAAVNESRAKVGSATKMPKRGNFKDEAITDKALSKVMNQGVIRRLSSLSAHKYNRVPDRISQFCFDVLGD